MFLPLRGADSGDSRSAYFQNITCHKNKREKERIQVCAPVFDCSQLSFWNSNQSNSINGSDGSAFHPLLTKDERIYIFTPDLCRYELPVPPLFKGAKVNMLVTIPGNTLFSIVVRRERERL